MIESNRDYNVDIYAPEFLYLVQMAEVLLMQ
jgi:hypothetical protein